MANTNFIVALKNVVKVQNLIDEGTYDILKPRWICESVSENGLLPLNPRYTLFMTKATKEKMLKTADKFGDSYTKEISASELKEIFKEIDHLKLRQQYEENVEFKFFRAKPFKKEQILEIEEEYWPEPKWWYNCPLKTSCSL